MGKQHAKFKLQAANVTKKLNWDILYLYLEKELKEMWDRHIGSLVLCLSEYKATSLAQQWQKQAEH